MNQYRQHFTPLCLLALIVGAWFSLHDLASKNGYAAGDNLQILAWVQAASEGSPLPFGIQSYRYAKLKSEGFAGLYVNLKAYPSPEQVITALGACAKTVTDEQRQQIIAYSF